MATLKYRGGQYDVPLFERNADLFAVEPIDATPPPGLIEEPPAAAEAKPDDDTPAQPAASAPKSRLDPVEKKDMRTSATGNVAPSGSGDTPRESSSGESEESSAGVP